MWGGGLYSIRFVASVGRSIVRSVRPSVRPSPIRVRSITPLLMEGFPSNLNDTFTSTRGCAEPMLRMCQLKVNVTVKGQIFNKQILHIMSCPLYNSFTKVLQRSLVFLYWKRSGASKINLAVYRINIIIRTVCQQQRQHNAGEVGRGQETFLLNT